MKKILMIIIVTAISFGATAQHGHAGNTGYHWIHVIVVRPVYYPPYYFGYYNPFYNPYNNPFYRSNRYTRETKLELKIDNIRSDYQDKIWSARHDKSLSRSQRKETVHQLKHERTDAINQVKMDYYKTK